MPLALAALLAEQAAAVHLTQCELAAAQAHVGRAAALVAAFPLLLGGLASGVHVLAGADPEGRGSSTSGSNGHGSQFHTARAPQVWSGSSCCAAFVCPDPCEAEDVLCPGMWVVAIVDT